MHTDGEDGAGNPKNSWPCSELATTEELLRERGLLGADESLDLYRRLRNGPLFEILDR